MTGESQQTISSFQGARRGPEIAAESGNLWELLEVAARDHPDHIHIIFRDKSWRYAESLALAERASAGLAALGIGKGDRVGLMMPNTPAYIILCFALWRIGAVGVGINMLYPDTRIVHMLRQVDAKMLVGCDAPADAARIESISQQAALTPLLCRDDATELLPSASTEDRPGNSLAALLNLTTSASAVSITRDDLAMLQFTGGTTGNPKAAMLSHGNLLSAAAMGSAGMHAVRQAGEGWSAIAPFTHVTGLILYIAINTAFAGRCVIMERFDPTALVGQLRDGEITVLTAIPTMLTALMAQPGLQEVRWDSLSLIMAGGAPIPLALQKRFMALTGRPVLQAYGLTETGAAGTMLTHAEDEAHLQSAGRAVPGIAIAIRDIADPERPAADGEAGEICLKGPNVIAGYLGDADPQAHRTSDGYFRTGDVGRIDADGYLFIEDRMKDVIICSGYNVYPRMVEEAVQSIAGVREAAAIGLPDAYRGETVAIALVKDGDPLSLEQMQQALKDLLSPVEMPKRLFLFDSLPKTENHKVSRTLIRDLLIKQV